LRLAHDIPQAFSGAPFNYLKEATSILPSNRLYTPSHKNFPIQVHPSMDRHSMIIHVFCSPDKKNQGSSDMETFREIGRMKNCAMKKYIFPIQSMPWFRKTQKHTY
jgi:hypothetical protein